MAEPQEHDPFTASPEENERWERETFAAEWAADAAEASAYEANLTLEQRQIRSLGSMTSAEFSRTEVFDDLDSRNSRERTTAIETTLAAMGVEGAQIDGRIGTEEQAYLDRIEANYSDRVLGSRQAHIGERLQTVLGVAANDTGTTAQERAAYVAAGIDLSQFSGLSSVRMTDMPEAITPPPQPEGTTAPTRSGLRDLP